MPALRTLRALFTICFGAALAGCALLLARGPHFETNILSLLPSLHRDPTVEEVLNHHMRSTSAKVVLMVKSPTDRQTELETLRLADELRQSNLFSEVTARVSTADLKPLVDLFLSYPFQLAPIRLEGNPPLSAAELINATKQRAFSPEGAHWLQYANQDPLLLLPSFLDSVFGSSGQLTIRNGFIHADSNSSRNVLITATIQGDPFGQSVQDSVSTFLHTRSVAYPASLLRSGVTLFAAETASRTKSEVSLITSITFLLVLTFLGYAFRSPRAVLLIVGFISSCFGAALFISHVATLALHGIGLHLITIGFGSCLLGVSVDYAIHYLIAHKTTSKNESVSALQRIGPGITLGALTTIVGFLGIAMSPFPGLQQLALFCIVGLLFAVGAVILLFPLMCGPIEDDQDLRKRATSGTMIFSSKVRLVAFCALLPLLIFGLPNLSVLDDIRALNSPSPKLLEQQRAVAEAAGLSDGGTVVIVEGASAEETLEKEERVRRHLDALIREKRLGSYRAASSIIPSRATQTARDRALRNLVRENSGQFIQLTTDLHLPATARDTIFSPVPSAPSEHISFDACVAGGACRAIQDLWIRTNNGSYVSLIPLTGWSGDPHSLESGFEGVRLLNHADTISMALRMYRESATKLTLGFYAFVFAILLWRYGFAHAYRVMTPPILGAFAALSALGLFGIPINVFSVFALMVLIGVSVDYAIFFAEDKEDSPTTRYAILLSAITTIISFGALSFSSSPALQSFGIVLSVGVLFAALSAPLAHRHSRGS